MPLYGQGTFRSITHLVEQLRAISHKWLDDLPFSAYVLTQDQRKHYGLTLHDLLEQADAWANRLFSLTAVASHPAGPVIRVNVQFFPAPTPHRVRYLIATGDQSRDYAIRYLLTGEAIPSIPLVNTRLSWQEVIRPNLRPRDALTAPRRQPYQEATLTLHDHFFASRDLAADLLVDLCNQLSNQFFDDSPFHLRLETIDGDFHLHLDRQELRYLFQRQRDKRLMLYLDNREHPQQWLSLRVIYHPLFTGPNAEVQIISPQADQILDLLHEVLGESASVAPLPARIWLRGRTQGSPLTKKALLTSVDQLVRTAFSHISVVAWVGLKDGASLSGLSLYQLEQRLPDSLDGVLTLGFFLTRISTGQVMTLWLERSDEDADFHVMLGLMWGDDAPTGEIKAWWLQQNWTQGHAAPVSSQQHGGIALLATRTEEGPDPLDWMQDMAEEMGHSVWDMHTREAHRVWEQAALSLFHSQSLWVEMSYKQPQVVFLTELAHQLGRNVRILMREGYQLPPTLEGLPVHRYRDIVQDRERLLKVLG